MKCELCNHNIWRWEELEYIVTKKYFNCGEWKTDIDEYSYAHKKCIIKCKK
jgi:hypothetical protein